MDETSVNLETVVSYDWMPTNTRTILKTNNRDQKDCVIGSVSPKTGDTLFMQTDKVDSHSVSFFIQKLSQNYSSYENILILDNASYHVAQGRKDFPMPENVKLFYLPTYSPDLNPIERLWKYFKDKFINNRFFKNIYQLRNMVNDALYNLLYDCNTVKSLCGKY